MLAAHASIARCVVDEPSSGRRLTTPVPASESSRPRRPGPALSSRGPLGRRASRRSLAPRGANFPEPGLRARERSGGCSLSRIPSPHGRDRLHAWPLRPSRADDELPPLTLPVTPARSFDLAGAEDLEPRVTSMTLGRRARSAFRPTSASFVTGRLRGPCARFARHLGATLPSHFGFHRSLSPEVSPSQESLVAPPPSSSEGGELRRRAGFRRRDRRSGARSSTSAVHPNPRARSVGLIHPAAMRPRGRLPDAGRRRLGEPSRAGLRASRQGPTALSRRRLDRRPSSACATRTPTILSLPHPRRAQTPLVARSWRRSLEKLSSSPSAFLRRWCQEPETSVRGTT